MIQILTNLSVSAITIMAPLLLAATGGLFTELSGMLNIALEGLMLVGAFASIAGVYLTDSLLLGLLIGVGSSMLLSMILASVTLYLKANVFITGLAANLFASGITVILSFHLFGNRGVITFDTLKELPDLFTRFAGQMPLIAGYHVLTYLSVVLLVAAWVLLYRTPFGMRLRGVGFHEQALASLGLSPHRYRFAACVLSGLYAGLGGAALSLHLGSFVPNITAGRGWIALVAVFLGQRRPIGILLASFIFAFAEAFSNYAQGAWSVPSDFLLALPYAISLFAIIFYSVFETRRKRIEYRKD